MAKSINRYFQFIGTSKNAKPSGRLWYPAADVYETPDGWLVKVELAGVSAEDVEIGIHGNISANRRMPQRQIVRRRFFVSADGDNLQPF